MNYTEIIKTLREEKELTQNEVATVLGISRSAYKNYELQNQIIPIKHLVELCNYFDVSIDYILGLTDILNYFNVSDVALDKAGERLKTFRKEHKLTQKKLAEILNTTFSSVAWYEKGRNLIATPFLYTICKKYKISADYLLGRIDDPKYIK